MDLALYRHGSTLDRWRSRMHCQRLQLKIGFQSGLNTHLACGTVQEGARIPRGPIRNLVWSTEQKLTPVYLF